MRGGTEVITGLGGETTCSVMGGVVHNDGTETLLSTVDGSVLEGEIGDVVLVNHAEDGLLLNLVNFGFLIEILVHGFELPEAIIADQLVGYLLGFAVVDAKGCGKATGSEAVQICLFGPFLTKKINGIGSGFIS